MKSGKTILSFATPLNKALACQSVIKIKEIPLYSGLMSPEPPVKIVGNSIDVEYQEMLAGDDLILACEVSRANAPVQWYCNDKLLTSESRTHIESSGTLRKIIISNIRASDSGKYVCDAVDDKMISVVRIQGTKWGLGVILLNFFYTEINHLRIQQIQYRFDYL